MEFAFETDQDQIKRAKLSSHANSLNASVLGWHFILLSRKRREVREVRLHDGHISAPPLRSENQTTFQITSLWRQLNIFSSFFVLFFLFFFWHMNVHRAEEERGRSHCPDGKADTEQSTLQSGKGAARMLITAWQ